ncbi:MAG: DUF3127 domain-containing protein [Bacteroidetes bacterium]|nr:DUF3127 domain-containing protein [Bacteroidota bacterium]
MSELKIIGTIKKIGEVKTFDSGFVKREFILTTEEQYPQEVKFEAIKEKATDFEKYRKVGDRVGVKFNVRGNEYEGKHFVNLQMWYVESLDITEGNPNQEMPTQGAKLVEEGQDDLPF